MHLKVSELASRYRFSVDAIYAWVRTGLIPACCVLRIGNSMRIESEQFEALLRAGKLYRPRRRTAEEIARHSHQAASAVGFSEDQHTTRRDKGQYEHRFVNDAGNVKDHPFGPRRTEMSR